MNKLPALLIVSLLAMEGTAHADTGSPGDAVPLIFLAAIIAVALIPAFIAKSKGRSFGAWAVYSIVLPPVALIHALISRDERLTSAVAASPPPAAPAPVSGRICPECAETIKFAAIKCRFCGCWTEAPPAIPTGRLPPHVRGQPLRWTPSPAEPRNPLLRFDTY